MAEWQARMSSKEFAEWMAFYRIQPFGERRADFRFGSLQALMANVNRDPKKSKEFTPDMFTPDFEKALDEQEAQDAIPAHEQVWNKIRSVFGSRVKTPPPTRPTAPPSARGNGKRQ